jgi:hypothetical protein
MRDGASENISRFDCSFIKHDAWLQTVFEVSDLMISAMTKVSRSVSYNAEELREMRSEAGAESVAKFRREKQSLFG